MRRYPLEPFMHAAEFSSMVQLRRVFPMNGREYRRVIDSGLSFWQADRWACRVGLLPEDVWPEWRAAEPVECGCGCGEEFMPVSRAHVYWSDACAGRARYAANAGPRRRVRRERYGRNADAEKARKRAYEAANRERINAARRARRARQKTEAAA